MADHLDNAMDMKAHAHTYDGVIGLLKWGTAGCIVIAAFVIWLIA